jgi:uncharacterized protein YukE
MNGCEYMADKIEMQTEVMGEMVTNFRNVCRQIDDVRQEMIRLAIELEESFVSECSLPIQSDISYIISTARKLSDWSYSLSSRLNKAKDAFINADNAAGNLISSVGISSGITSSLYRGESAAEKLAKYKSISILTNKKTDSKLYESNWDKLMDYWHNIINDKTPPLARLGIGEIPSSSDGIAYLLNDGGNFFNSSFNVFNGDQGSLTDTLMSSLFGTVLGSSSAYMKDVFGYLDENNIINLYPNSVKIAPFEGLAKKSGVISKMLFGASAVFDLGNTWSAYSGNTVEKRIEKSGIQIVGDGISFGSGIITGAVATFGVATIETPIGAPCIGGAVYGDYKITNAINDEENKLYKQFNIK